MSRKVIITPVGLMMGEVQAAGKKAPHPRPPSDLALSPTGRQLAGVARFPPGSLMLARADVGRGLHADTSLCAVSAGHEGLLASALLLLITPLLPLGVQFIIYSFK